MATITTTELAAALGTTPRTARKFLRSSDGKGTTVGKGARWAIEKKDLQGLRRRFAKWSADQAAERADRATRAALTAAAAVDEAPEGDDAPDDPTDLELDEIDEQGSDEG